MARDLDGLGKDLQYLRLETSTPAVSLVVPADRGPTFSIAVDRELLSLRFPAHDQPVGEPILLTIPQPPACLHDIDLGHSQQARPAVPFLNAECLRNSYISCQFSDTQH